MGRLRVLSGMILQLESDSRTVSVPNHKEPSVGTLGGIIRELGLPRTLFEA